MLVVTVRCSLHSLCPDLSWYNNYPSRSGRNDFTLLTYCDQWWGGGECGRPSSLSKSRQEYNIICYILTGSSHTHISQLMVLKIARVSISNDVEMSPVSLYLVEAEIGALAAQWWVLLRQDCVFTEPGNTQCRHHHYNKDLGELGEGGVDWGVLCLLCLLSG